MVKKYITNVLSQVLFDHSVKISVVHLKSHELFTLKLQGIIINRRFISSSVLCQIEKSIQNIEVMTPILIV